MRHAIVFLVMYPAYAKWIQSHRDLPLKLNQWCNIVVSTCILILIVIKFDTCSALYTSLMSNHNEVNRLTKIILKKHRL